jgi:hypothetical protein
MTRDDIIKMAREAGATVSSFHGRFVMYPDDIERFAALVAAHERESVAASSKRDLTCVCGAVWDGEQMVHAPRKREWVGLTEPELHQINPTWPAPGQQWDYEDVLAFARSIEAKLKEKNT